jgi:enoyl-CoA hydratase/carnithine racemase
MTKVRFAQDGAVGIVTLANPPLNQLNAELISDLSDAVDKVEAADGLRALLVRGDGDVFSAGADVSLFSGRAAEEMRPLVASFLELGRRVESLPLPALAAVHGMCMAGGFELALFCDLVWAAAGTRMGLPETSLGIVPLAGGVERVAARAGIGRARALALTGRLHPAEELLDWGAIDRVLPADQLHAEAERFVGKLAAGPTAAFAVVKELSRAYCEGGVPAADARLLDAAVGLFDSDDACTGIETFLAVGPGKAAFAGR